MPRVDNTPRMVYVLRGEYCTSQDGEVAWVESVHATRVGAFAAMTRAEAAAVDQGEVVLGVNDDDGARDWDVCFQVDAMPLHDE